MVAIIVIDECVGCGTCIDECPAAAMALNADNIAVVNASDCLDCGACVDVCPTSAIKME